MNNTTISLIAALTSDRVNLERGLTALELVEPGVFLAFRDRLRAVAAAGGAAGQQP